MDPPNIVLFYTKINEKEKNKLCESTYVLLEVRYFVFHQYLLKIVLGFQVGSSAPVKDHFLLLWHVPCFHLDKLHNLIALSEVLEE